MRSSNRVWLSVCLALVVVTVACKGEQPAGNTTTTTDAPFKVTDVTLGRAIGGDKAITDQTEEFRPNDTIYASVATDGGGGASTVLRARWTYGEGQVVNESTATIAPNNRERTEFHISKPDGWPVGNYQIELFVNDRSVHTKKFEVSRD